jgi:hypothetical protein
MKIIPKKSCVQHVLRTSPNLLLFFLICILLACTPQQSSPSGTIVPWGNVVDLIARSESHADLRKNYLEVQIKLKKHQYCAGEKIMVTTFLRNKSDQDLVVRDINSMPVLGNDPTTIQGVVLLITNIDTGSILERGGLLLSGFVQEGFPPPEGFSVLKAQKSSVAKFDLSDIFGAISSGRYTVQLIYTNYNFGAEMWTESGTHFIDYDAWTGTISSNIEQFQITP